MPWIRADRRDLALRAVERLRDISLLRDPEVAIEAPAELLRPLLQLRPPSRHGDQRAVLVGLHLAQRGWSRWVGAVDMRQRIVRVLPSLVVRPAAVILDVAVA